MILQCGKRALDISFPVIMGILNITPDSFSDGGSYYANGRPSIDLVLQRAEQMLLQGAAILDVGGESTRPGAALVGEQEELDRVVPVVEALVQKLGAIVSVDTSRASVMRESAICGAGLINDVRALSQEGALSAAAETGLPVCLMHMQGQPDTMQLAPDYNDIVSEVSAFLTSRVNECLSAGVLKNNIILDPGFGFGKTLAHNLTLLARLPEFVDLGFPVLAGLSRKSLLGHLLNKDVGDRLLGSVNLAQIAVQKGASFLRVHDVAETADMLKICKAVQTHELNS